MKSKSGIERQNINQPQKIKQRLYKKVVEARNALHHVTNPFVKGEDGLWFRKEGGGNPEEIALARKAYEEAAQEYRNFRDLNKPPSKIDQKWQDDYKI